MNCAINKDGNRTNKNVFMDYQRTQTDVVFKPLKRVEELVGKDKNVKMDLIVARKIAEKSNCSYIFGKDSREIFFKKIVNLRIIPLLFMHCLILHLKICLLLEVLIPV